MPPIIYCKDNKSEITLLYLIIEYQMHHIKNLLQEQPRLKSTLKRISKAGALTLSKPKLFILTETCKVFPAIPNLVSEVIPFKE